MMLLLTARHQFVQIDIEVVVFAVRFIVGRLFFASDVARAGRVPGIASRLSPFAKTNMLAAIAEPQGSRPPARGYAPAPDSSVCAERLLTMKQVRPDT